jgi:hypothetical protein
MRNVNSSQATLDKAWHHTALRSLIAEGQQNGRVTLSRTIEPLSALNHVARCARACFVPAQSIRPPR